MAKREVKLDLPKCGTCGALSRQKFPASSGGSKNTRTQHSRWRVCGNGHQLYVKR